MDGDYYERELCRTLDSHGYHVVRSPASGSATERELPDAFYSKPDTRAVALELKSKDGTRAYYQEREVVALEAFAHAFDSEPRLFARWKGDTAFYGHRPEECHTTPEGNYRVDRDQPADIVIQP